MMKHQCPNQTMRDVNKGTREPHDWYPHIVIFGISVVKKCRMCSARRIF